MNLFMLCILLQLIHNGQENHQFRFQQEGRWTEENTLWAWGWGQSVQGSSSSLIPFSFSWNRSLKVESSEAKETLWHSCKPYLMVFHWIIYLRFNWLHCGCVGSPCEEESGVQRRMLVYNTSISLLQTSELNSKLASSIVQCLRMETDSLPSECLADLASGYVDSIKNDKLGSGRFVNQVTSLYLMFSSSDFQISGIVPTISLCDSNRWKSECAEYVRIRVQRSPHQQNLL